MVFFWGLVKGFRLRQTIKGVEVKDSVGLKFNILDIFG